MAFDWLRSSNTDVEQGNTRFAEGDAEGALQSYDAAVTELPQAAGAHLNRGLALMAQGKLSEARRR